MFRLFYKKDYSLTESQQEKLNERIFSFIDSYQIVSSLPFVSRSFYQALKESAYVNFRILVYKCSLKPDPLFSGTFPETYSRLSGGYSNCTYKFCMQARAYIARVPGRGTESFIDRAAESYNVEQASKLGLNPEIKYTDRKGTQISVCLDQPQSLTPELLKNNPHLLIAIAGQLKALHSSKKPFANDANIFKRNESFFELIKQHKLSLPVEYQSIKDLIQKIQAIFSKHNIKYRPCHNDTYFNNFLLSGNRVWIIDWEYSGNHDPIWDLAYFSKLSDLSEEQNQILLAAYFSDTKFKANHCLEYQRFIAYKLVIDDFVLLWAYVQIANKNNSVTPVMIMEWANGALKSALAIMQDPKFKKAISILENPRDYFTDTRWRQKSNGQIHEYLIHHNIFNNTNEKKESFLKSKDLSRKEYREFAAEMMLRPN